MRVNQVFFRTGDRIHPDQARAMVALMLNEIQPALMASLMNYHPDSKKSQTSFPPVHFSGAKNGFSIIGFGETGATIAEDVSPIIHKALAARLNGKIIQVQSNELQLKAEKRPYALRYCIGRMVVQKHQIHRDWLKNPEKGKKHIEDLFLRSLKRQAEAVGLVLPEGISVEFMGANGEFAAKQKPEDKVARLGLKQAMFDVNLKLEGIWTAGYMLSKGFGAFNASYQLSAGQEFV